MNSLFSFRTKYAHNEQPTEFGQSTPAGYYPAKILDASEAWSNNGKHMLVLTIEVDAGGSHTISIREYLILENSSAWKIEQYLAAIGVQFGQGEDVTIDCNTFIGRKLYLLTFNEPGRTNPDRLFVRPLRAVRREDVKKPGPLSAEELTRWGLNPDGTRQGSKEEQRANAQPHQQQSGWGTTPTPASKRVWGEQPAQPSAPVNENLEDDDIPF